MLTRGKVLGFGMLLQVEICWETRKAGSRTPVIAKHGNRREAKRRKEDVEGNTYTRILAHTTRATTIMDSSKPQTRVDVLSSSSLGYIEFFTVCCSPFLQTDICMHATTTTKSADPASNFAKGPERTLAPAICVRGGSAWRALQASRGP